MSKNLVIKALCLIQEGNKDKAQNEDIKSSSKKSKRKKNLGSSQGTIMSYASVDKTDKNLEVLKRLRQLRPSSSVAQKVIKFYTKQNNVEDDTTKLEPQRSILFDDDDDEEEDMKKRKRRKKEKIDDTI